MRRGLLGALAAVVGLSSGCFLGDGDDDQSSPYENAALTVPAPFGVADGMTGVEVAVTGDTGTKLVLEIIGDATFVGGDENNAKEKTVFLADDDGVNGSASAFVVTTTVGPAAVAFKPDPLRGPQEITFRPVTFSAGAATPVRVFPGFLAHDVCVSVNSAFGKINGVGLVLDEEDGSVLQSVADVSATMPAGLDCPTEAVDEIGWAGWAVLEWRTVASSVEANIAYETVGGSTVGPETVMLTGEAFPGYEIATGAPQVGASFVSVDLTVTYPAVGGLASGPAAGVSVVERFIPGPGPDVLGASSGGMGEDGDPFTTDDDGAVTVFYDPASTGTFAWFVTLTGGESIQLPDLVLP